MPSKDLEIIMQGEDAGSFVLLMPDGLSLTEYSDKICGELVEKGFKVERSVGANARHSVTVGCGDTDMRSAVRMAALVIVVGLNAFGYKFTHFYVLDGNSYFCDTYLWGPVP